MSLSQTGDISENNIWLPKYLIDNISLKHMPSNLNIFCGENRNPLENT
jgi:hypothetical protein